MAFTAEQRAKAAETRKRNAEDRRLKKQNEVTGTATTEIAVPEVPNHNFVIGNPVIIGDAYSEDGPGSWTNMPLNNAVEMLSNMKREYDMAAQIVMQRQSREPVVWTCWTQAHKDIASKAALKVCKGKIPDGRWVSKDDGFKDETGKIVPQVTCSMICYQNYSEFRSKSRDRSRGL